MVSKKIQNQIVPIQNNFKESTRKKLTESRSSIDGEHEKKMKQFREKDILDLKIKILKFEYNECYFESESEKETISDIIKTSEEIYKKEHQQMIEYLLNLGQFLLETSKNNDKKDTQPSNEQYVYLKNETTKSYPKRFPKPLNISRKSFDKPKTSNLLTDIVTMTDVDNKGTRYRRFVDNVINGENCIEYNQDETYCVNCGTSLLNDYIESTLMCPNCGLCTSYIDTTGTTFNAFTDTTIEPVNIYEYKRINHLNDWMMSLQGQESVVISNEIILLINDEIKKMRIDKSKLKPKDIKIILKKLKLNKYYEHTHAIITRITNKRSIHLSSDLQKNIKDMFRKAENTFLDIKNKNRSNFLSYSYLLNKMVALAGRPELCEHFPLLKSRSKLSAQETIWKEICSRNGWTFIPSL